MIMNLNSDTNYSFKLNVYLSADISNQTSKTKQSFKFTSEPSFSYTFSVDDAFNSSLKIVDEENKYITIQFNISDLVLNNYDLIEIYLNQRLDKFNQTKILERKNLKKQS